MSAHFTAISGFDFSMKGGSNSLSGLCMPEVGKIEAPGWLQLDHGLAFVQPTVLAGDNHSDDDEADNNNNNTDDDRRRYGGGDAAGALLTSVGAVATWAAATAALLALRDVCGGYMEQWWWWWLWRLSLRRDAGVTKWST